MGIPNKRDLFPFFEVMPLTYSLSCVHWSGWTERTPLALTRLATRAIDLHCL